MSFLSKYIGSPVVNVEGDRIGFLKDIIARHLPDLRHPMIQALVVQQGNESFNLPYSAVVAFIPKAIPLKANSQELGVFSPQERDIFLARDVLDKQIIDTEGARVVRVNDVELMRINGSLYIGNVDIGGLGLLRRLGLDRVVRRFFSHLGLHLSQNCIAWDDVELLPSAQSVRLKVPVDKIAQLHPADVAEILSDLNRLEGGHFLAALDVEQLADTLEEVEPEFQASLVESMPDEKVADILEEMEPDEAADLLAELPEERSRGLLELMQAEEAKEVRRLLTYPVESAGGIMTTWFATVRPDVTAEIGRAHV